MLLLLCAREAGHTNIFDPDFDGDYQLSASFATVQDTFTVFKPYAINYKSSGRDTFTSYMIAGDPVDFVDTSLFRTAITSTTMTVYFTKPAAGAIKISGIHPNTKETEVSLPVIVKNPFKLQGAITATAGQMLTLSIAATVGTPFQAQWYVNGELTVENPASLIFSSKSDTACVKSVYAIIKNVSGHAISTDTVTLTFNPRTPVVKFLQDSIEAPVGQETAISTQSTDCDSIRWIVKHLGLQTTITGPLKVTFTAAGKDTVIAVGLSRFGVTGKPDTLYVRAMAFNYTLQTTKGIFPDTIRARHWATWRVQAMKNGAPVTGAQVVYEWKTTPDSLWD